MVLKKKRYERPERISLPVTRIRKLANLAIELGLATLKVGEVVIVPGPAGPPPRQPTIEEKLAKMDHKGKRLTEKQKRDVILFGSPIDEEELENGH